VFWVISVYFNIRSTLPKSGTFLLGHPVYPSTEFHYEYTQYVLAIRSNMLRRACRAWECKRIDEVLVNAMKAWGAGWGGGCIASQILDLGTRL